MASGSLGTLSIDVITSMASMVADMGRAQQESAKAAKEFQKQWTDANNAISDSFQSLVGIIGVGISFDWLKDIAAKALEGAEQVDHLSQTLGISQQTLQTMGFAAGLVGGNLDTATQAFAHLEKSAEQAAAGSQQQVAAFNAIGISAAQLKELLKDPDQLIQQTTADLANFADGAGKTAATMVLFGRGAAQNIPFLNELGQNFDALKQKAIDFGVVLSAQDQSALVATQENINTLKEAGSGLANEFTLAIAPAINAVTESLTELATSGASKSFFKDLGTDVSQFVTLMGEGARAISAWMSDFNSLTGSSSSATKSMTSDLVGYVQNSLDEAGKMVNALVNGWVVVKADAAIAWNEIENDFGQLVANIESGLGLIAKAAAGLASATGNIAASMQLDAIGDHLKKMGDEFKPVIADVSQYTAEIQNNDAELKIWIDSNAQWAAGVRASASAFGTLNSGLDDFTKSLVKGDVTGNMQKLALAEQSVADSGKNLILQGADQQKVDADTAQVIDTMTAAVVRADKGNLDLGDTFKANSGALKSYQEDMQKLSDLMDQIATGLSGPYLQAVKQYDAAEGLLNKTWADAVKAGTDTHELLMQLQLDQDQIEKRYVATTDAIKQQHDEFQKLNDELSLQTQLLGVLPNDQAAITAGLQAYNAALKANVDLYGNAIAAGQDIHAVLNQELPDWIALKQHVNDVSEEVKNQNQVWKDWEGIATNAFDTAFADINKDIVEGGSVMKDLVNVAKSVVEAILMEFEKLAIINPLLEQIFGTGVTGNLPTLASSNLGSLFSGNGNGLGGIANLFGGGADAAALSASQSVGVMASDAGEIGEASTMWTDDFGSLAAGGDGTMIGTQIGESAGSSFLSTAMPVIGGVMAGFGEFQAAGGGIGGLAGGAAYGLGTAGLAIGASAAMSGGIAAGMAAIPVVGWIGLAAMALNMVTGGGLFGTAWKPTGNTEEDFSVGATGASVDASAEESKKKALFGGKEWKTVPVAVDQQTTDAVNAFYTALQTSISSGAKALGEAVPPMITGAFAETFDKSGKITSQISTVLGQTYSETLQQFQERITGENLIALLPAATGAEQIADKWRASADSLLAGSEFLDQAYSDNLKGMSLLGSSDSSLTDIDAIVEKLSQSGETLVQTYMRLQTEQLDTSQALAEMGLTTNNTGADFVQFADDMTTAAGGLQNLQTLWSNYYSTYYSSTEQMMGALSSAEQAANTALSGIGENVDESMAQFREDFTNAMPNLTGAQVTQWLQASQALAGFNTAVNNVANAVKQAEADASQLSQTLFGTDIQQLQAQINAYAAQGMIDPGANAQLAALQAQAGQQQQLGEATQLLEDFGNIGAVTGQSLQDFATKFNVPLDKLATMLGTDNTGLQKEFDQQEAEALSNMQLVNNTALTNQLLASINAAVNGTPISIPATGSTSVNINPSKPAPPVVILPTQPGSGTPITSADAAAIVASNQAVTTSALQLHRSMRSLLTSNRGTRGTAAA